MPYATARDGTKLYVKDWGKGRPVVLIHGWPLSADSWDPIAVPLAEAGFRAIAYDRRGFGRSDQPWDGYDYDTFADDLGSVLEAAGVQDGISLVGFSMGGGEVARYLSRNGGRGVDRAALIGSIVPYVLQTDDNPDGVPQSTFDDMERQMRDDRGAFFQSFFRSFYGVGMISQPVSNAMLEQSFQVAMQAGLRPTLAAAKAFSTTDFRPDLSAFTMPTLIVHGTSDQTVPIGPTAHAAARAITGSTLIEYDGSAHGIFGSDRERLTHDLLTFLGSSVAPRTPQADRDLRQEVY
jgi:pimeloyl-ACP methyl ester carboxylesterase